MKCIVCNGSDLAEREVEEEIRRGSDVIMVPVSVLVCASCGERYYSRQNMHYLEQVRSSAHTATANLREVGKVFVYGMKGETHVA